MSRRVGVLAATWWRPSTLRKRRVVLPLAMPPSEVSTAHSRSCLRPQSPRTAEVNAWPPVDLTG